MRDELVEAVKVAILTAIVEHGVPTDIQEHLVRGDGRGTVLPGALDRMAQAALAVAEPAIREQCATLIERRNPNEGGRLDALAIRAGQGEGER